jgi:hypothetical protein
METDPVSETYSLEYQTMEKVQKPSNSIGVACFRILIMGHISFAYIRSNK